METQVKERLTGAIIVVAVLVLLVPELLSGPQAPAPEQKRAADEPPMRSYTIELTDNPRPQTPVVPAVPAPVEEAQGEAAADSAAQNLPEETETSGPSADSDTVSEGAAAPADAVKLAEAQPQANEERPQAVAAPQAREPAAGTADSKATATQPPADSVAAKPAPKPQVEEPAKRSAAAKPRTDETASNPVPKPAQKPATAGGAGAAWAVQVGSFSSRENADRLVRELKGFRAFVAEGTSNGRKVYRVRVGPEASRASAQSLATRLKAAGRSATVVAHP